MFPAPASGNLAPAPVPVPTQAPAQQHGNPAPQAPNTAPQVNNVVVPDDPRGTKRSRENNPQDSDEPVLKLARTEPAAVPDGPEQKLIKAIRSGDLSGVRMLLRQSPQLLNSYLPGNAGPTPLCLAAQCGQKEIAGYLLSSGSSINTPAKNGSTPLMFASQQGHVELIRQLCLLGADPKAINPKNGVDALVFAVEKKQLGACKELIANGADMQRVLKNPTGSGYTTPLLGAIARDFSELLDWWLDAHQQHVDSIEPASATSLLNLAVSRGALKVVCSLLQRGADPNNAGMFVPNSKLLIGVWKVAIHFQRWEMVECLLSAGLRPNLTKPLSFELYLMLGSWPSIDLCNHLGTQTDDSTPADRLKNSQLRQQPDRAIEGLAERFFTSSRSQLDSAVGWWCDQGLLAALLANSAEIQTFIDGASLLGQSSFPSERYSSITGATQAQQSLMLVESLSDTICSPDWTKRFSGLKLTPEGEQIMNQIAVAQGELLLKGIASLRERFEQQVTRLSNICMNSYIAISHLLNEPDLYRRMTREWGLYDPVARAAIRLVKEAYEKLRTLSPQRIPAEFSAKAPAEKLQHVIVYVLEEWDKIPELLETFQKCKSAEELEFVSDLLLRQWRMFSEALGVTKPRYSRFGPNRQEVVDIEPQMKVEVVDSESHAKKSVEEQISNM